MVKRRVVMVKKSRNDVPHTTARDRPDLYFPPNSRFVILG